MSRLSEHPEPVKLVVNFFFGDEALLNRAISELALFYGPPESRMDPVDFDHADYYSEEMEGDLKKTLVSFAALVPRDGLVEAKRRTMLIEQKLATRYGDGVHRPVNIDPGFLMPEKFVLATGRNVAHRIYLGRGVYADLTLLFKHGRFELLPWTYTDYLEHPVLDFLFAARERLLIQLKELKI
jgi:hypothetical protein